MFAFQNRRRASQRQSEVSQADVVIWSNRPYGCTSMKGARDHATASDPEEVEKRQKLQVVRKQKLDCTPEWCYRHEHPLRVGLPGKLYSRHDFVTPITDSMNRLQERTGGQTDDAFGVFFVPRKRRRLDKELNAPKPLPTGPKPRWTCKGCGSTDERSWSRHNEATCCPCGTVVFMGSMVATHREKLGASEEEDKTQHADKVVDRTSRKYDHPPPTLEERRKERRYAGKVTGTPGRRLKGVGSICAAQQLCNENAAKEDNAAQVAAGTALTRREEVKFNDILKHLETAFRQFAPVDHVVKVQTRKATERLWLNAVHHCRGCERHDCCELRLVERPSLIVASAVFHTTIERMLHGALDDEGTSREHLLDLQARTQRAVTNASALTQIGTAKVMINIFQTAGFDAKATCAPRATEMTLASTSSSSSTSFSYAKHPVPVALSRSRPKPAPPAALSIRAPFARTDSSMSCDGSGSPVASDVVEFRDAVGRVFVAHNAELPVAVRDGAFRAIQSPGFVKDCKEMHALHAYSLNAVAFCVINAVWREQHMNDADGQRSFVNHGLVCPLNVGVAHRLEIDLAVAEEAIEVIRPCVPTDAASEASVHPEGDDLFS
tara:strand:- start:98 stop:1918 length:1821 start_codon:yes stop_codon:yes gene_type:complete